MCPQYGKPYYNVNDGEVYKEGRLAEFEKSPDVLINSFFK